MHNEPFLLVNGCWSYAKHVIYILVMVDWGETGFSVVKLVKVSQ